MLVLQTKQTQRSPNGSLQADHNFQRDEWHNRNVSKKLRMLLLVGILGQHHTDIADHNGSSSVVTQTPTDEIFRKDWGDFSVMHGDLDMQFL